MKITSISPKQFAEVFRTLDPDESVLMKRGALGLHLESTKQKADEVPEASVHVAKIRRADLLEVLKALVALQAGRPVKLVPSSKTQWTICVGPK